MWSPTFVLAVIATNGCGRAHFERRIDAGTLDARSVDADLAVVGCADGEREAFDDVGGFPTIAGCAASWSGDLDLRAPRTGFPCGDDLGACAAPVDACAPGWHLCADTGDPTDLTARITDVQCATAGGSGARFAAASNHCSTCDAGCTDPSLCHYALPYGCGGPMMFCLEAVCCGGGCNNSGNTCRLGFFSGLGDNTIVTPCDATPASALDGVLCCAD